jgi:hypothetical protein
LPRFVTGLAEHGEQNCCQDRNYRDHHQQFNQSEADTKTNLKVASPNYPKSVFLQHLTFLLFLPLLGLNFPSINLPAQVLQFWVTFFIRHFGQIFPNFGQFIINSVKCVSLSVSTLNISFPTAFRLLLHSGSQKLFAFIQNYPVP